MLSVGLCYHFLSVPKWSHQAASTVLEYLKLNCTLPFDESALSTRVVPWVCLEMETADRVWKVDRERPTLLTLFRHLRQKFLSRKPDCKSPPFFCRPHKDGYRSDVSLRNWEACTKVFPYYRTSWVSAVQSRPWLCFHVGKLWEEVGCLTWVGSTIQIKELLFNNHKKWLSLTWAMFYWFYSWT